MHSKNEISFQIEEKMKVNQLQLLKYIISYLRSEFQSPKARKVKVKIENNDY